MIINSFENIISEAIVIKTIFTSITQDSSGKIDNMVNLVNFTS